MNTGQEIASNNTIIGSVQQLRNAGAPTAGTNEVQTLTLTPFAACTLTLGFEGETASITFAGTENNAAIDTAVTAALVGLNTVGASGMATSTSGTTNRAIAITYGGNLGLLAVPLITASVSSTSGVSATLTTALTGTNNDLVFTAVTPGTVGNAITVAYVDPGANNASLNTSISGNAVTVSLATGVSGTITSTANSILNALMQNSLIYTVVTTALAASNDGTGVVTAMAATSLASGVDAPVATVVETTAGVTVTGRGAGTGSQLTNTTNGDIYSNEGTVLNPVWGKVGVQS